MPHKKNIIELRHYSLPISFPVMLLSGDRWHISDIPSGRLHFHDCLEIGICHSNSGFLEIDGQKLFFKEGDVTCIPRHIPHTTYSSEGTSSLWSYIFWDPDELFKNTFRRSESNFERPTASNIIHKYIFDKNKYPRIYYLSTLIEQELCAKNPFYQESVHGLLYALYIELMRIHQKESTRTIPTAHEEHDSQLIIGPALAYIYQNYMRPITVEELAQLCYLSPSHFRRLFNEVTGTTPLTFINSTRIDEACKHLQATDDSMLVISQKVGFHSISSFNRCFTKFLGMTPRQWKKKAIQNDLLIAKVSILEYMGWV